MPAPSRCQETSRPRNRRRDAAKTRRRGRLRYRILPHHQSRPRARAASFCEPSPARRRRGETPTHRCRSFSPEWKAGTRIPQNHSRIEPLNRSAAFTPLQCAKVSQHRKLTRRERRAPTARFMVTRSFIHLQVHAGPATFIPTLPSSPRAGGNFATSGDEPSPPRGGFRTRLWAGRFKSFPRCHCPIKSPRSFADNDKPPAE